MPQPLFGFDAYSPREISERVEELGVRKARLPLVQMSMLAVLAGAFIGLGALFATIVLADSAMGFAAQRVLAGLVFALGLLLVIVAGAELFTGNNLLAMAWAEGHLRAAEVLRNWAVVLGGNLIGAVGLALLVVLSGHTDLRDGQVAQTYLRIAHAKAELPLVTAFASGVLCNALVCLAVWMAMAGRSVVDKAVAVVFPVAAFVAAGFEHSVANLYFFAVAIALERLLPGTGTPDVLTASEVLGNLAPVILGNVVGGSVLVAGLYSLIYRRTGP